MEQQIGEQDVILSASKELGREFIVSTFIDAARSGDVSKFILTFPALDWKGAWRDVFQRLVAAGSVHPSIRPAFVEAWDGVKTAIRTRVSIPDWHLERDFDGHRDLMIDGLKLLMPPHPPGVCPLVLYRGQRLEDHQKASYGVWWVSCPVFAEIFGRTPSRTRSGAGVVVMAVDPHAAIIGMIGGEVLVDPRLLDSVQTVSALPPHLDGEMYDPKRAFLMQGIPDGFDGDRLLEWIDRGRPVEGLASVRNGRASWIERLVFGITDGLDDIGLPEKPGRGTPIKSPQQHRCAA